MHHRVFSLTCALLPVPQPHKKRTRSAAKATHHAPHAPSEYLRLELLGTQTLYDTSLLLLVNHPQLRGVNVNYPAGASHSWSFSLVSEESIVEKQSWTGPTRQRSSKPHSLPISSNRICLEPGKTLRFLYSSSSLLQPICIRLHCVNVRSMALLAPGTCARDFPTAFMHATANNHVEEISPPCNHANINSNTNPVAHSCARSLLAHSQQGHTSQSAFSVENCLLQLLTTPPGKGCIRRLLIDAGTDMGLDTDMGSRGSGGSKKQANGGVGCRRRRPLCSLQVAP